MPYKNIIRFIILAHIFENIQPFEINYLNSASQEIKANSDDLNLVEIPSYLDSSTLTSNYNNLEIGELNNLVQNKETLENILEYNYFKVNRLIKLQSEDSVSEEQTIDENLIKQLSKFISFARNLPDISKIDLNNTVLLKNDTMSLAGFIGYSEPDKRIYLIFRQTRNIENVLIDLKTSLSNYSNCNGCKVHTGFKLSFEALTDSVKINIDKFVKMYPYADILIGGHSLGGAIAGMFVDYISKLNITINMVTFGAPRIGNKAFSEYINDKINGLNLRITYKQDMVPMNLAFTMGYYHSGNEINYYNLTNYNIEKPYTDNGIDSKNLINLIYHVKYSHLYGN